MLGFKMSLVKCYPWWNSVRWCLYCTCALPHKVFAQDDTGYYEDERVWDGSGGAIVATANDAVKGEVRMQVPSNADTICYHELM
jgi:hypothetical protein